MTWAFKGLQRPFGNMQPVGWPPQMRTVASTGVDSQGYGVPREPDRCALSDFGGRRDLSDLCERRYLRRRR